VEVAQSCAPYVHPKLNASDVRVRYELSDRSDAELAEDGLVARGVFVRTPGVEP
jgi:hypothetical protein